MPFASFPDGSAPLWKAQVTITSPMKQKGSATVFSK
jgi:hypothetical protein